MASSSWPGSSTFVHLFERLAVMIEPTRAATLDEYAEKHIRLCAREVVSALFSETVSLRCSIQKHTLADQPSPYTHEDMRDLEVLLVMVVTAVVLAALARRVGAPYPVFLAVGGARNGTIVHWPRGIKSKG